MTNRPNRIEYRNNKDTTDSTTTPSNNNNNNNNNSYRIPVEWLYSKNIPIKSIEEKMPNNINKQFNLNSSPNYCEMSFEYVKQLLAIFSTYEHETSFLDI